MGVGWGIYDGSQWLPGTVWQHSSSYLLLLLFFLKKKNITMDGYQQLFGYQHSYKKLNVCVCVVGAGVGVGINQWMSMATGT